MELEQAAAGPYLRALISGLRALSPNTDHVPLAELIGHLEAMEPRHSGLLFAPFVLDGHTGLPAYDWLERVLSEAEVLTAGGSGWTEEEVDRAMQYAPDLGGRLQARRWFRGHLRGARLLPSTRLQVQQRTAGRRESYAVCLDRVVPSLGWMRIRLIVEGSAGWSKGLWTIQPDGSLRPDEGLRHLISRHAITPLVVLQQTLEEQLAGWIPRLARGVVGPFWFPGCPADATPPQPFRGVLSLQMSSELMGTDVLSSVHRDPLLEPVAGEEVPVGQGIFRERRFAVSTERVEMVRGWCKAKGCPTIVVPIGD